MFDIRETDRLGLYAVGMLFLLALAMVATALFAPVHPRRAPQSEIATRTLTSSRSSSEGGHHEAPRVTPGPVAGSAGSRTPITQGTTQHAESGATAPLSDQQDGNVGWIIKNQASAESFTISPSALHTGSFRPRLPLRSSLTFATERTLLPCTSSTRTGAARSCRCLSALSPSRGTGTGLRASDVNARGYTCGKVTGLFTGALAMLASEARDKVVRIDTRALPLKAVSSAQQQESAGRPASEDDCASGSEAGQSPAEQPATIRGAA